MPEPITLLGIALTSQIATDTIGTIIGGILGNRSDTIFCNACRTVYDRLKNQSEPVNHDIQRAVREAYLKATLLACERLLYQKYNWIDRRFHFPTYDLKEVIGYVKKQLKEIKTARFIKETDPVDVGYVLLLQPNGQTAQERTGELKQQLRESLLHELTTANLCVEDDLKAAIWSGWVDERKQVDWYELLCAFFAEELKTNTRLSTIIQTELLLGLRTQAPDINWSVKLLEQQATLIGEVVQPLVGRFDEVMARLNSMLQLLVQVDNKVDRVQETVEEGNQYSREMLPQVLDKIDKLEPQTPARAKYLNAFARYDFARLIGRMDELTAIDYHLTRHKMLFLRGMGGIGKTTLIKAYLDRSRDAYDHLAYVDMVGSVADSMLNQLGNSPDVAFTANPDHTHEEKFAALIDTLRRIPKLLLVIDNIKDANDAVDLRKWKDSLESLDAIVIITGRVRMPEFMQAGQLIELGSLSPEESFTLFERYLERSVKASEIELVNDLLKKAFYHAKLIEVIATQISRNFDLTLADAKTIVTRRQFINEVINYPDEIDEQAKTIYRILLDLFDTDPLADELKQLLRYIAVLPTIDIPVSHLNTLLGVTTSADRKTLTTNLRRLAQTAWLDQLDTTYFSMHGLVQWVVRERLLPTASNCNLLIEGMAQALSCQPAESPLDKQIYLPYVKDWLKDFMDQNQSSLANTYNNAAFIYGALGQYNEALQYHQHALSIRQTTLGENHLDVAKSLNYIGIIHNKQGDYENALEYHQKAFEIRQSSLGADSDIAESLTGIGVDYVKQGQYTTALKYLCQALKIQYSKLGLNHPDTARTINNIGNVYKRQKQFDKALKLHLKALNIREITLIKSHPDTAKSLFNIGVVYKRQGKYSEALKYHQRALDIRNAKLGDLHPDTIISRKWVKYIEYLLKDL